MHMGHDQQKNSKSQLVFFTYVIIHVVMILIMSIIRDGLEHKISIKRASALRIELMQITYTASFPFLSNEGFQMRLIIFYLRVGIPSSLSQGQKYNIGEQLQLIWFTIFTEIYCQLASYLDIAGTIRTILSIASKGIFFTYKKIFLSW